MMVDLIKSKVKLREMVNYKELKWIMCVSIYNVSKLHFLTVYIIVYI